MTVELREVRTYLGKFNFEFDPLYLIDRIILQDGYWELQVASYITNFIKPGMVVVDVGANAGYHTLLMADKAGASGKVYAFEPNRDTRDRLVKNLKLNPSLESSVQVSEHGVGSKQGTMYVSCDMRPGSIGNAYLTQENSDPEISPTLIVKLDDFIPEPVSFLKIDVEGMELEVILGAQAQIEKNRPIIVFETLTTNPPERHKPIEDFLKQFGYRIFCPTPDGANLIEIGYPLYPFDDSVAIYGAAT